MTQTATGPNGAAGTARADEPRARPTARRGGGRAHLSDFTELTATVKERGLMQRAYGHYWTRLIGLPVVGAVLLALFLLLGDTWWQMVIAVAYALLMTQIAFLGHDAAHRQIFRSGRWNEWTSMIVANLFVGIGVGAWTSKHNKHHGAPNKLGADPDIESNVLVMNPEAAPQRTTRWGRFTARIQGWYFFPLLTLEGLNLHYQGLKRLFSRRPIKHRGIELTFILVRLSSFVLIVLAVLPLGKAAAFLAIGFGLFGFYLAMAFAPNHMGMPIVPRDATLDFLRRQVLMSRNISGGRLVAVLMGGLNYQIEHHLFPSMSRPNLRRVAPIVREYCRERGIAYYETGLLTACREVAQYVHRVGRGQVDVWQCPMSAQLGR